MPAQAQFVRMIASGEGSVALTHPSGADTQRARDPQGNMSSYPVQFGKYLLLDRINVGGMAEVFRAKTFGVEGFERILAIKRILPNLVDDADFVRMFIDEARIVVQLAHPNIAQIYELGKHGASYFIAMEYLPSRDLRTILDNLNAGGQLMPIQQAAFITSRVCDGLDYAHRRRDASGQPLNIVHRDVSPQNILITYEGVVKVIDFGIAKAANRASQTQAGVLKGKFGYMSPEQVSGQTIDRRSDIFAVGVLLYEMLTGERLFISENDYTTLDRVRKAVVPPPTKYNKKISPELEEIVLRALAREPEDRYQWASELADDLLPFLIEDRTVYNNKRLEQVMKETYAGEIAAERMAMEDFLRIGPDDATGELSLPDEAPTSATPARMRSADPVGRPPTPHQDHHADPFPPAEHETDQTFILEAGLNDLVIASFDETGQTSPLAGAAAATIPSDNARGNLFSAGSETEVGRSTRNKSSDFNSSELPDLDDDAATMVSIANPLLQNELARATDTPKPEPALGAFVESSYEDGDATVALAGNPMGAFPELGKSGLEGLFEDEPAEVTATEASLASAPSMSSENEPPPLLPSTLLESHSAPHAANPSMPPLYEASGVTAPAPRAPAELPRRGLLAVLLGLFVLAGLLLCAVVWRWMSEDSITGTAVLVSTRGPAPPKLQVLLDGQIVAEQLPLQIPLPGDLSHVIEVRAEGYQSSSIPISPDVLLPGKVLPLPIALVKHPSAPEPAVPSEPDAVAPSASTQDTGVGTAPAASKNEKGPAGKAVAQTVAKSKEPAKKEPPKTNASASPAPVAEPAAPQPAENNPSTSKAASTTRSDDGNRSSSKRSKRNKRVSLSVGTRPSAKVWVDGKQHRYATPLMRDRALSLTPGEHTLLFVDPKTKERFSYRVNLPSDSKENKIIIILGKSEVVKEGKAVIRAIR